MMKKKMGSLKAKTLAALVAATPVLSAQQCYLPIPSHPVAFPSAGDALEVAEAEGIQGGNLETITLSLRPTRATTYNSGNNSRRNEIYAFTNPGTLYISNYHDSSGDREIAILDFDFPQGVRISRADLFIPYSHTQNSSPFPLRVNAIFSEWDETSISGAKYPSGNTLSSTPIPMEISSFSSDGIIVPLHRFTTSPSSTRRFVDRWSGGDYSQGGISIFSVDGNEIVDRSFRKEGVELRVVHFPIGYEQLKPKNPDENPFDFISSIFPPFLK